MIILEHCIYVAPLKSLKKIDAQLETILCSIDSKLLLISILSVFYTILSDNNLKCANKPFILSDITRKENKNV